MSHPTPEALIRPYEPHDLDGIRALIPPIQRQEFDIPITWEDQSDLHDIPAFYRRGKGEFWVAEAEGMVVGTIALIDIGGGDAALRKMFVHRDWRGGARGVAASLLQTLLGHGKARHLHSIYLGTTDKFLAAHRFYEKHGFDRIAVQELPPNFPRMAVDTVFFRLALG